MWLFCYYGYFVDVAILLLWLFCNVAILYVAILYVAILYVATLYPLQMNNYQCSIKQCFDLRSPVYTKLFFKANEKNKNFKKFESFQLRNFGTLELGILK